MPSNNQTLVYQKQVNRGLHVRSRKNLRKWVNRVIAEYRDEEDGQICKLSFESMLSCEPIVPRAGTMEQLLAAQYQWEQEGLASAFDLSARMPIKV